MASNSSCYVCGKVFTGLDSCRVVDNDTVTHSDSSDCINHLKKKVKELEPKPYVPPTFTIEKLRTELLSEYRFPDREIWFEVPDSKHRYPVKYLDVRHVNSDFEHRSEGDIILLRMQK